MSEKSFADSELSSDFSDSEADEISLLLLLPPELHLLIASHLDTDAVAALCLTNKHLLKIYKKALAERSHAKWALKRIHRKQQVPEYVQRVKKAIETDVPRSFLERLLDAGREYGYRRYKAELPRLLVFSLELFKKTAIRTILDFGVDVNVPVHGYHPIHYASRIPGLHKARGKIRYDLESVAGEASPDQFTVLQWLLDNGAKVNSLTNQGETPLMKAAECGQTDIIRFLVSKGAWANLCTKKGTTALSLACRRTFRPMIRRPGFQVLVREDLRYECVNYLVSLKVPISLPSNSQTGLHAAVHAQHHRLIELLLDVGADPNAIDKRHGSSTPFMEAVRNVDETAIITFLKLAGDRINFDITDAFGKTALEYAVETKQNIVVDLIYDVRAKQSDKTRSTPEKLKSPKRLEKKQSMGNGRLRTPPRLFFGSG